MIEGILFSTAAFIFFLFVQALLFHFKFPKNPWRVVVRLAGIFFILYTLAFWFIPTNIFDILNLETSLARPLAYANGVLIYIFWFFSYAQFYFLIDRGVSARILVELERSAAKKLTLEEIQERYRPRDLQKKRLDDMVYGGYLKIENGSYVMTPKGRLNAKIFDFAKRFINLNPGG